MPTSRTGSAALLLLCSEGWECQLLVRTKTLHLQLHVSRTYMMQSRRNSTRAEGVGATLLGSCWLL